MAQKFKINIRAIIAPHAVNGFAMVMGGCALFAFMIVAVPAPSYADKVDLMSVQESKQRFVGNVELIKGMADVIEIDGAVSDIMVADPSIVDVMVLQANKLYMVGSNIGSTNIIAVDAQGNVLKKIDVRVKIDDKGMEQSARQLFPNEDFRIKSVGNQVILTGHVSSPDAANKIMDVVGSFVAGENKMSGEVDLDKILVNMMSVSGEQQVMLRVKIVEASRDVLRELGVNTDYINPEGSGLSNVAGFIGGNAAALGLTSTPLGIANVLYNNPGSKFGSLQIMIQALEKEGLLNTLAEPNLTAISGQEAGFLAGGEFPIPASRDQDGNVVIDYRPFGVALNFRPVVMSEDRISLQLRTEVSSISNQNSLTVNQLSIPGFSVRRAQTTVEMGSGGSLMIAGLLRSDITKSMSDLPGIKQVPVLGDLVSSESFQRQESELVVIVTAYLVKPYGDRSQAHLQPAAIVDPNAAYSPSGAQANPPALPIPEIPKAEATALSGAFGSNIRRIYARRNLDDSLFNHNEKYGYLID
jgi:pilus assembly protein CpaC